MAAVSDPIRLLGKTGGYTDKPSRAMDVTEPEAVRPEDQARISEAAAQSWPHLNALHEGVRAERPFGERIARCKAQARHIGVDVHGELRLLRLTLNSGRSRASIERRLEVLEGRLWPSGL